MHLSPRARNAPAVWLVALVLLVIVASGLFLAGSLHRDITGTTRVYLGNQLISARIADSSGERARGLSRTKPLDDNQGMLFVFDHSSEWAFWMKDMNYSLDVIWLDEHKKVVDIKRDATPDTYPQSFAPKAPARYMVEVSAGFAARHRVAVGSEAYFSVPNIPK